MIDKPTRVTPTSSTLLDLAITNKPDAIHTYDVVLQEIADHDLIIITVDVSKPRDTLLSGLFATLVNIPK